MGQKISNADDPIAQAMLAEMARQRTETLHPDLAECLHEGLSFGTALKHPLVFQVPYYNPGMANETYAKKQVALAEALAERDWNSVIYLHERPYRLWAFEEFIKGRIDGETDEYAGFTGPRPVEQMLLRDLWIDSENIWQNIEEWQGYLMNHADQWMTDAEKVALDALPDSNGWITVYRGGRDTGLSWTTDRDRALWFAQRHHNGSEERWLFEGYVQREDVTAYLLGRSEHEIVVADWEFVSIDNETEVQPRERN